MIFGTTKLSYRKATEMINRVRYQQDGDDTPCRTLQEATEREGTQFLNFLKIKSECIFKKHAFNSEGQYEGNKYLAPHTLTAGFPTDQVAQQVNDLQLPFDYSDMVNNPVGFEAQDNTVNITIDDVTPKR